MIYYVKLYETETLGKSFSVFRGFNVSSRFGQENIKFMKLIF